MSITADIRNRVLAIVDEMNNNLVERHQQINSLITAVIGQQHLTLLGPGGVGKSMLIRNFVSHVHGAEYYERALDESTILDELVGPTDVKSMVETGVMARRLDGTLATAHYAFLDEFFNCNAVALHGIMPILNERVVHDNGVTGKLLAANLRSCFTATNKLNADADLAALWDRMHIRDLVGPVAARSAKMTMIDNAIRRINTKGRGASTNDINPTMVTVGDLDQAFTEATSLDWEPTATELLIDVQEELEAKGIMISPRRLNEGAIAAMATAWLRGHDVVMPIDLDILARMWWNLQDQEPTARATILTATNPGEKAALDLLDTLDGIRSEFSDAAQSQIDDQRKRLAAIEAVKNTDKLIRDAKDNLAKTKSANGSTARLDEVLAKADSFKAYIARDIFGLEDVDA